MTLYQFEVPVPNYENDGIFFQSLFVEADSSPTKEQMITVVENLHERDSKYPEYTGDWMDVLKVFKNIKEWPRLYSNLIYTGEWVDTDFGKYTLSVRLIRPILVIV